MNYIPPTLQLTKELILNVHAEFALIRSQVASSSPTLYKHPDLQMILIVVNGVPPFENLQAMWSFYCQR